MTDFSQNGAIKVNGQWATAIRYEAEVNAEGLQEVDLRFLNSRTPIARVTLSRVQALDALGEVNLKAIERGRNPHSQGSKETETLKGELRGKNLSFREVAVPLSVLGVAPNEIRATPTRESKPSAAADPPKVQDGASPLRATPEPKQSSLTLPPHIADKYLIVKNRFHFADQSVAFVDKGDRLLAKTENSEVIRDLLGIAQSRGWASMTVTGSTSFRRAVWREAMSRGLGLKGYHPSEVERLAAARARSPEAQALDAGALRSDAQGAYVQSRTTEFAPNSNTGSRTSSDPHITVVYGTFAAAGRDYYRHDPTASVSFYVKISTATGERIFWGVGIEDALEESRTQVRTGDEIGIRRVRSVPVTVPVAVRDAEGRVMGRQKENKIRNEWAIEKRDYFSDPSRLDRDLDQRLAERADRKRARAESEKAAENQTLPENAPAVEAKSIARVNATAYRARKAQAFRQALRQGQAAQEKLARDYPEIGQAFAWVRVAQIVAERIMTNDQREDFIRLVEEGIATRLLRGDKIKNIDVRESVRRAAQTLGSDGAVSGPPLPVPVHAVSQAIPERERN